MKYHVHDIFKFLSITFMIFFYSCANLVIHDMPVCAIANTHDPKAAAACDYIYTSHPQLLTMDQWLARMDADQAEYCVSPQGFAYIKQEVEDACSLVHCTYEQAQAIQAAFTKIQSLGELSRIIESHPSR